MKVFPDTNVLISAFLSDGTCYRLVRQIITGPEHELIIGEVVLEEAKRKLRRKIRAPEPEIVHFAQVLLGGGLPSPVPDHTGPFEVRDPDDAWVLASAVAAGADVLVTGDRDLLDVAGEVVHLRILSPRELWDLLQNG
ncbi:MAG TPA: putative toxin-antitoxin system toxin component, PIN family [Longimicrobiaceae bacterium]|nr:putative toxin-antitoxin system toxin component, PIN family [Longimicrobiaceae bacterium]